jgi:hypothetical protein
VGPGDFPWASPLRASQARPGPTPRPSPSLRPVLCTPWPVLLHYLPVRLTTCPCGVPPGPCGFALLLSARVACLSHLVGVWHCSLAIGHGPSAGLLVGVLDSRPVSPLSSSRACSGAGSGWHCCGWIAVSAVPLLEGLAPWRRALARALFRRIASGARPRLSWGRPTERGLPAGQLHCGSAFGQVAVSPNRAPGAPGQVGRKFEPGAALAAALRLDYDTHAASSTWLTMVVHKVLSCIAPGTTPLKRKAPDSSVDGQIVVPETARKRGRPPRWERRSSSPRQARSRRRTPRLLPGTTDPRIILLVGRRRACAHGRGPGRGPALIWELGT